MLTVRQRGGNSLMRRVVLVAALAVMVAAGFVGGRGALAHGAGKSAAQATSGLDVQTVEQQLLGVTEQLNDSAVSSGKKSSLLSQLSRISAQLRSAEAVSRQLVHQNVALDVLLQTKLDTMAVIDQISDDLQINLDDLEVNVNATVNANVEASVGGIDVNLKAQAAQVQADLTAKTDQLLVDVAANLDVIKVISVQTVAHIDAEKFSAQLHALVTQLTLDLTAVVTDLTVMAKADVQAALQAEAKLRVDINAQLKGVRTKVLGSINTRIGNEQKTISGLERSLNSTLSSLSSRLTQIENQL